MQNNVVEDILETLNKQENLERLAKNKVKCLAICIKIVILLKIIKTIIVRSLRQRKRFEFCNR